MQNFEISLPSYMDEQIVEQAIDFSISELDLIPTLRCTLKKYPDCTHWHIKNGREPGTLEITFWPIHRRAWFTVQDGRKKTWIAEKMKLLERMIKTRIKSSHKIV